MDVFKERYGMSFEDIAARFRPAITRRAYAILRNYADAEDVTQEVFLTLYQKPELFDSSKELGAWINVVTRNAALDLVRKKRHYGTAMPGHARVSANPEKSYIDSMLAEQLIARMKKENADVVVLQSRGYTQKEISRITGVPEGTVKARLYKAQEDARLFTENHGSYYYGFRRN